MNQYIKYEILEANPLKQELIIASLNQWNFDGYEQKDSLLLAYGQNENINVEEIEIYLNTYNLSYTKSEVPEQNWNTDWEKAFNPIVIQDFCGIRADFHLPIPNVQFEIIITPKMSFGTGHHATTQLVIELMKTIDFKGKTVIDFGTGTGILAILSEKMGAQNIVAIDNDSWCIENASENIQANKCQKIEIIKADNLNNNIAADIILANINRNIIIENFNNLSQLLKPGGQLIISGFLAEDEEKILNIAVSLKMIISQKAEKNNWLALKLRHIA